MTALLPLSSAAVTELLAQRRSIRRLSGGVLSPETIDRLQEAALRTPAAFGVVPWHVVILREERETFWDEVEAGFRTGLGGERLHRYLERLAGFRDGAAVILIYEDLSALPSLRLNWGLAEQTAQEFVQQGLGMVQLALWLVLTADGLVTSLQHWDWLIQERLATLLDLPTDHYRLVSTLPVGLPAEPPRDAPPIDSAQVVRIDPLLHNGVRA